MLPESSGICMEAKLWQEQLFPCLVCVRINSRYIRRTQSQRGWLSCSGLLENLDLFQHQGRTRAQSCDFPSAPVTGAPELHRSRVWVALGFCWVPGSNPLLQQM